MPPPRSLIPTGVFGRPVRISVWALATGVRLLLRHQKRLAVTAYLLLGLMGAVTFTQFILEEALQQIGFTCYHYKNSYRDHPSRETLVRMEAALTKFEAMQDTADQVNTWIGWINPLSRPAFAQYNVASRLQLEAYRGWLADRVSEHRGDDTPIEVVDRPCTKCNGTGQYKSYGSCYTCGGTGRIVHDTSY